MDTKELNTLLGEIIKKKHQLSKLDYSDQKYDDVEEELHDLEDEFNENFGDHLEDVLDDIHQRFCPDTDVLLPTAYLPKVNFSDFDNYKPTREDGVTVEVEAFPGKDARLVLISNPARILLAVGKEFVKEVWRAE